MVRDNYPSQGRSIDLNKESNEIHPASTDDEESPRRIVSGKSYDIKAQTKANEKFLEILIREQEQRANGKSSMKELMMLKIDNDKRKYDNEKRIKYSDC